MTFSADKKLQVPYTVVEHLPHHPKIKGLSPTDDQWREKQRIKEIQGLMDKMTILVKTLLITLINAS